MKNWLRISLFLFIPLAVIGEGTPFYIYNEGVEIALPEGWEEGDAASSGVLLMGLSPANIDPTFRDNFNVVKEEIPSDITLEYYYSESLKYLKQSFKNFKVLERKNHYHIYTFESDGFKIQQLQYFYIKNSVAYVLTFTSIPKRFKQVKPLFEQIEKSLVLPEM
jgi:hypothetical protein